MRDPFEARLPPEKQQALVAWLVEAIQSARDARATTEALVDYWQMLYEQGRTRLARTEPWPDAADLTSPLATMYVDALHARTLQTVFTEPICVVEGWGPSSDRAAYVEAFHQWKQEDERLQSYLDKAIQRAWIEPAGILEVIEGQTSRQVRKHLRVRIQRTPDGSVALTERGEPALEVGPDGRYIEAGADEASADVVIDSPESRTGPEYQVIPWRDLVTLPGHARDAKEVWGYAKRFWRRLPQLEASGLYTDEAIRAIGTEDERQPEVAFAREGLSLPLQRGPAAEKELWEVLFLADLTNEGERWYVATLHLTKHILLRLQHDDLGQPRYIRFVPFPRSDSVDGYSLVGHKLITAIEEHTAWRNMAADRAAMITNAPIKRIVGALWDPNEQPWGPKAVIDVRDPNEVQPVAVPDLTGPALTHIRMIEAAAERLVGINDISLGAEPEQNRTLGERQLVANYSEVRINVIIKRLQESIEQLYQIRHAIWKRALAEHPDGLPAPSSVLMGLETKAGRRPDFQGRFTAMLLEGDYRFKPRGSVETADLNRQRTDLVQLLGVLSNFLRMFPPAAALFQRPEAIRALTEQILRDFRFQDRQAILGDEATAALQQAFAPRSPLGGPAGGAPPGLAGLMGMLPPGLAGMMRPGMPPPGLGAGPAGGGLPPAGPPAAS